MKRIIIFLLLTTLIFSLFLVGVCAEYTDDAVTTDENSCSTDENNIKGEDTADGEGLIPDELYTLISQHIGEIFAVLACAFSGLLMVCYKKGILPLINGGITALSGGVSELSREAQKQSESSQGISAMLSEKLKCADELLTKMGSSLAAMEKKLNEAQATKEESEITRLVLLEEVNMLYEVFMAATLPEYQKERISKQVSAMREKLEARNGEENEEN